MEKERKRMLSFVFIEFDWKIGGMLLCIIGAFMISDMVNKSSCYQLENRWDVVVLT